MADNTTLNVLGCVPSLLNILFELADEARNIKSFNILKNIPVEISDYFVPDKEWKIEVFNTYNSSVSFNPKENYALSVVGVKTKELVYKTFKQMIHMEDKQFIRLIHPSAYISKSVNLDYGIQIEPLCNVAARTSIGFAVNIKRNSTIGHHCTINEFVTINPGVTLSSFVKVGKYTMIGSGTSVKDNITIGENSIIGVGSVVINDIPGNSIAYGNPCKVHKTNNTAEDTN